MDVLAQLIHVAWFSPHKAARELTAERLVLPRRVLGAVNRNAAAQSGAARGAAYP